MTREECTNLAVETYSKVQSLLLLLPTGMGKSAVSIKCFNSIVDDYYKKWQDLPNLLIVVDKKVQIDNWKKELEKWDCKTDYIEFCCYASLHKLAGRQFEYIILDECHHIKSDIRMEALNNIKYVKLIGLSATLDKNTRWYFIKNHKARIIETTIQDAIEEDILPDPQIYLIPLILDTKKITALYEINKKGQGNYYDFISNIWKYKRERKHAYLRCTPQEWINQISKDIDYWKDRAMTSNDIIAKNMWMRLCNDRLKKLSEFKTSVVETILKELKDRRTLTFCNSIQQCEKLGKNNIHSKNKIAQNVLDKFNNKKIKHITSCNMLNEAVNLTSCEYGIFANIMASETIQIQRIGRLLRHKNPKLIIPYYVNTREEEILNKWLSNYSKEYIKKVSLNDLLTIV